MNVDKKDLDKIEAFFKSPCIEQEKNVSFGIMNLGGGITSHFNRPCHFGLGTIYTTPKFVFTKAMDRTDCSAPAAKAYNKWLVNESPWSECFLSKDEEYIDKNGFIMDVDAPNCLFYQAAIMSRQSFDKYYGGDLQKRINIFYHLSSKGYDKTLSFIFSQLFSKKKDCYIYNPSNIGHTPFAVKQYSWKSWENLYNKKSIQDSHYLHSYKKAKGRKGRIDFLWDKEAELNEICCLKAEINNLPVPSSLKTKSLNIFSLKEEEVIFTEEDLEFIMQYIKGKVCGKS